MKKNVFKIAVLLLVLVLVLPFAVSCKDDDDGDGGTPQGGNGFNPYPYPDLSVFIDIPDYKSIVLEKKLVDKLVYSELMLFCQDISHTTQIYEGTAQLYDYVTVTVNPVDEYGQTNGPVFDQEILLGNMDEIEQICIGMNIGDSNTVTLQNQKCYITLKSIERTKEITDAFCQTNLGFETKDEYMRVLEETCVFKYVWDQLMNGCVLKGYPTEYTQYYSYFTSLFEQMAQNEGMAFSDWLYQHGGEYMDSGLWYRMTESDFRQVAQDYAKSNLINDLLTYSIMRAENIQLSGAEWDAAVKELEAEMDSTYVQIVENMGENSAIISVLTIRISDILKQNITITN